ncbi:alpha/beta hydrolase [Brachybacterium sp. JHP9]|uniref:Alpha/beta hydrolase n=1 Tax=Brachybacterium equifaecis TaxID=2910770 RepID=A0ABT0QXU3_9MICO|nr:alpha/beta hydrolase [Brachybacterium equifaecis]MCL6422319.1 alpha/beta hydrolase [Brachybacterium equifaecis]
MRPVTRNRRSHGRAALRAMTAAIAGALLLAGCDLLPVSGGDDGASDGGSASSSATASPGGSGSDLPLAELGTSAAMDLPTDPATDPAYEAFYSQRVQWGPCEADVTADASQAVECGTVRVPLAWNDPSGQTIDLAVVRVAAGGEAKGSLFVNPGGPGASGVDFVAQNASYIFSQPMRQEFDIIGFDPRGISRSAGIECLDDAQTDEYRADTYDGSTDEGLARSVEWMKKIAAACEEHSGAVLPYLDTYSAARDMDVLRSAVGSEKLDYLGYSYGTYLGSSFADLYPERVGRFVLDGVMDPSITGDELTEGQAGGFQHAIEQFVGFCLEQQECALRGPSVEEGVEQLEALMDSIAENPIQTSDPDRPLTGALASAGLSLLLYGDENWSFGVTGLNAAANGDGTLLLMFADLGAERSDDGTYTGNALYSILAVNCLDHPGIADFAWQQKETERLLEKYPAAGITAYSQTMCDQWPVKPLRAPAEIHAPGSDLIVVIGTTGDPATPYQWAQSLDAQLDNSVLLTFEGDGHTAYGRSGGCIEAAVDAYFLQGTAPADGLTC